MSSLRCHQNKSKLPLCGTRCPGQYSLAPGGTCCPRAVLAAPMWYLLPLGGTPAPGWYLLPLGGTRYPRVVLVARVGIQGKEEDNISVLLPYV